MKAKRQIMAAVLVVGIMLGSCPLSLATGDDLTNKINTTNRKIRQLRNRESNVLGKLVKTQEAMDRLSSDLSKINSRVGTTQKKMKVIDSQLDKTKNDIEKIRTLSNARKAVLNQRLVSIYKYGYQSYLEVLFQVKDFSEFVGRFEMVGNFVGKDLQMLKALQQQHNMIANKKRQINRYQEELGRQKRVYDRLKSEAMKKHNKLKVAVNIQQRQLTTIQSDRETLEAALDEMEELSRSMESEIREAQKNENQANLGSGVFIWPTDVACRRITSGFGSRFHPVLKKYRYHSGIDIVAPKGTPIMAADNGIVIFSGLKGGYGKTVMIDHGLGYSTVYGHASVLLVANGQAVTKGQRIALVGSTGLSTGPHLHFEIRKNGSPQNPTKFL